MGRALESRGTPPLYRGPTPRVCIGPSEWGLRAPSTHPHQVAQRRHHRNRAGGPAYPHTPPGRGQPTARCTRSLSPHRVKAAPWGRGDGGHLLTGHCGARRPVPPSSLSTSARSRKGAWKAAPTQCSGPQGRQKTARQELKKRQGWLCRKSRLRRHEQREAAPLLGCDCFRACRRPLRPCGQCSFHGNAQAAARRALVSEHRDLKKKKKERKG